MRDSEWLSKGEFQILRSISLARNEDEPLTMSALAESMNKNLSNVVPRVNELEDDRLVMKETAEDSRYKHVFLTDRGIEVVRNAEDLNEIMKEVRM